MPIHNKKDLKGCYFQYGNNGKKYYYTNNASKVEAYYKALNQSKAIHSIKYPNIKKRIKYLNQK